MDESQLELHKKQKRILQNQNQLIDLKLNVLNKYDDVSCWSDSQRNKVLQLHQDSSFFEEQDALHKNISDFAKQNQEQIVNKKSTEKHASIQELYVWRANEEGKSSNTIHQNIRICKSINEDSAFDHTNQESHFKISSSRQNYSGINDATNIIKYERKQIPQKQMQAINQVVRSSRTLLLNNAIRKKINDVSDSQQYDQVLGICKTILSYFPWINKLKGIGQLPLLNNQSQLGFILKLVFTFLNCLFLYIFSLLVVFYGDDEYIEGLLKRVSPLWIMEILVKLNTIPNKMTKTQIKRKHIVANYLKTNFFFDIIPLIMTLLPTGNKQFAVILDIFIFLKIYNVMMDLKEVQKRLCMIVKRYYIVQLFNLMMQLFTIGHVISCLWYLLSLLETKYFHEDATWTNDLQAQELIWWRLYVWSLYWSLTLMTTGSNTATTISQGFFTSFIMLFTTITFGYFLNAIGIILSEMDEKDQTKRKDLSLINEYMRKRNISKNLQQEVNLNLQYYHKKNYKKSQEENSLVLEKISVELQKSILKEYNKQILNKISFLQHHFSTKVIEELSLQAKEEFYIPNQVILNENESIDCSLLYIISGQGSYLFFHYFLFTKQKKILQILKFKHTEKLVPIFKNYLKKQQIQEILKGESLNNEDQQYIFIFFDEQNKCKIQYLQQLVELFGSFFKEQNLQNHLKTAKKGEVVGQVNFFTGLSQTPCIRSSDFTKVLKIDRCSFINIIKGSEQDYERFCEIKDKLLFYQDYSDIDINCANCKQFNHRSYECPLVSFDKDISKFNIIQFQQEKQKRIKCKRKIKEKNNSLKNLSQYKLKVKDFQNQIRMNTQNIRSYYLFDGFFSSDEEDDQFEGENRQTLSEENHTERYYKKAQDEYIQNKSIHKQEPSIALSSVNCANIEQSLKAQKYQRTSSKQHQSSFNEFEDITPSTPLENQKISKASPQIEHQQQQQQLQQQQSDNLSVDSLKQRKQNQNINKLSSREITLQSELEMQQKKNFKINQNRRNSRLNLFQQPSQPEDSQYQQKQMTEFNKKPLKSEQKILQKESYLSALQNQLFPNMNPHEYFILSPWAFDKQKDYEYYFRQGNSKVQIFRFNRFAKKKMKFVKKKGKKV